MKAVVITQYGTPNVLKIEERSLPMCKEEEVLIKVYAAGINRPDILQREGKYAAPPGTVADIPGLEVAGEIVSCGQGVTKWKPGDKVCALLSGGGYAEYAVAHEGSCLPVPSGFSYAEAASLPETVFTVCYNVLIKGSLKSGETLLIHGGSSGIGVTAIQLAKAWGASVYVTAGSEEKCQACIDLGADKAINYREENFEEVLKTEKVDVVLDMVGGDYTNRNLKILKEEGRLVIINSMAGAKAEINLLDIMLKRLTVTGSTLRARSNEFKAYLCDYVHKYVFEFFEKKLFQPVVYQCFDMEEAPEAHEVMHKSIHIGKIVLIIRKEYEQ